MIVVFPGLGCLLMSCKFICLFVFFSLGCDCGISWFTLFVNLFCKFICLFVAFSLGSDCDISLLYTLIWFVL